MKAFALRRTGGGPAVVDLPVPEPGPGEVLVQTTAARLRGVRIIAVEPEPTGQRPALRFGANGLVDPMAMTTHAFPFTRAEEAWRRLAAREPGMVKPVILLAGSG